MAGDARDLSDHSIAQLLALFVSLSQEIQSIDHVHRSNRLRDTRRRVVAAIKERTDGTTRALSQLLHHDDPHVRLDATFYYGEFDPSECIRILRELALRKDKVGRDAAASLEWREKHPSTGSHDTPSQRDPSPRGSRLSGYEAPPGMSYAELEQLLFESFPRDMAGALMALARPAIRAWPQPLASASDTSSRFGGLPLMPKGRRWPATEVWPKSAGLALLNKSPEERGPMPQEPKWFLGQINCADVQGLAGASLLPASGFFSFFGDADLVTGCTGDWDYGGFYFFSGEDLALAAEPVEDFKTLPVCGLAFSDAIDLPDPFSRVIENLGLEKQLWDLYFEIRGKVSHHGVRAERYDTLDHSKLFGWPDVIQRELQTFADEGDGTGRLILQIGNYDNGAESWYWGPGGLVYFALSNAAFKEGDCAACQCEMQCT